VATGTGTMPAGVVITAVSAEMAVPLPPALVAVSWTSIVDPTSATVSA
jgi:hypothetical protein